jgi:murein L,D-transpeptidase YafK
MKSYVFLTLCCMAVPCMSQSKFIEEQLSFPRVAAAKLSSDAALKTIFTAQNLNFPAAKIYLRIFKQEQILEVWASNDMQYTLVKTYGFTATSGQPGPKVREGDLQIPEGFYKITRFNPVSNYHLSFKINYPNPADALRNKAEKNMGGDIYIHGDNRTIGCVPLGDENISELYWLCASAYASNPVIPVHIFPCKMTPLQMKALEITFPQHMVFWKSIEPMYRFFESNSLLGEVTGTEENGAYKLALPWD